MEPIFIDTAKSVAYYDFPEWCDTERFIAKEGMEVTYTKRYDETGSVSDLLLVCDMARYSDEDVTAYCQRFCIQPFAERSPYGLC